MTFKIQVFVLVKQGTPDRDWRDLRPSEGKVYTFETRDEAECMARMCYPDHSDLVRVVEVE